MTTIDLKPALFEALEQNASLQDRSVDDLVNEAVARYVRDLQREKLATEIRAYERLHDKLKRQHLGRWVAINGGRLVDHDADRAQLYCRVRERYGRTSVLIRQVNDEPNAESRWRGGSLRQRSA